MLNWIDKGEYATCLLANEEYLGCKGSEVLLGKFKSKKGKFPHYHKKKTEFFYILKGNGKVIIDGNEQELKPGVSVVIKPNQRHEFINESSEEMECLLLKTNNDPDDTYTD